jgi:hypothetical protein
VTLTLTNLGALASAVEAQIVKQLEVAFGPAWAQLTEAEKQVRIEQVRAQVALGESIAEAVASVALKAIAPTP